MEQVYGSMDRIQKCKNTKEQKYNITTYWSTGVWKSGEIGALGAVRLKAQAVPASDNVHISERIAEHEIWCTFDATVLQKHCKW